LQFAVNIWQRFQMPGPREEGPPAAAIGSNESIQLHLARRTFINPASAVVSGYGLPGLLTRGHLIFDWYFIAHYLPWANR
jgi:hypothetical protein